MLNKIELTAPGKTFLIGEYGVLDGGSALVICTRPEFRLIAEKSPNSNCSGIHPQSPAGQWIRENQVFFSQFNLEFIDPYQQKGGVGASSAQFLLCYMLTQIFQNSFFEFNSDIVVRSILADYEKVSWSGQGRKPSGADLIAQIYGLVTLKKTSTGKAYYSCMEWPFEKNSFQIFRTGLKLKTHEHLQHLGTASFVDFARLTETYMQSFVSGNWQECCAIINQYQNLLAQRELTIEGSLELVGKIQKMSEVQAVKACGAMGADTILVLSSQENKQNLRTQIEAMGLEFLADENMMSTGMRVFLSHEKRARMDDLYV